ncbi:RNA-directed DNA polymerase, eukaryota, reverse transcriptase zinc-binding domain protein [Tanacetum coccineum]
MHKLIYNTSYLDDYEYSSLALSEEGLDHFNGSTIHFWKDLWLGDEPLKSRFNRLFRLYLNEDCLLSDTLIDGNWSWHRRRPISSGITESMFHSLLFEVQHIMLSSSLDRWTWSIDSDGSFTVSSICSYIDHHLLPSLNMETRWNKCLPRKVNIYIWRFHLDRLPHRLNLSKCGLDIALILCPICNLQVESNQSLHSFEDCSSRVNSSPGSNAKKDRMFVIVASTFWILWKYRNSNTFHSHPMRKCDLFDSIRLVSFT